MVFYIQWLPTSSPGPSPRRFSKWRLVVPTSFPGPFPWLQKLWFTRRDRHLESSVLTYDNLVHPRYLGVLRSCDQPIPGPFPAPPPSQGKGPGNEVVMREAEPALQLSPSQQLMSHSNDPMLPLQVGLPSLEHPALLVQYLANVLTEPTFKYTLAHLSPPAPHV